MNKLVSRTRSLRPKSGFANVAHIGLNALLPVLLYVLVRIDFAPLAAALIILSKWRMFAVRIRYWPANVRANAVDIMVGLSVVIFMSSTSVGMWQVVWAVAYGLWLVFLKPGSSTLQVSLQAVVAQLAALMALFLVSGDMPLYGLIVTSWFICYLCARHFFTSFDEPYALLFSHIWGYFAAALIWILGHWLLFYNVLAQPTLLIVVIGYGLAAMYYLDQTDRLSDMWRKQFILMMVAIVVIVLTFSDWGDKAL
ncbi:MAG TPA: hypothetical protein VK674_02235 [Candidatus Limnocylindria bacterium]|nr:hypothetical protein [Candidatus Limnocylindria bacterium]